MKIVAYAPDGKTEISAIIGTPVEIYIQGAIDELARKIIAGQITEKEMKIHSKFLIDLQQMNQE